MALLALGVAAAALIVWQGQELWRAKLSSMSPVPRSAQLLDESLLGLDIKKENVVHPVGYFYD